MILFGVTGGIGCGKSVVCDFLKKKGIAIIEADPLAKELTNRLPEIRRELTREFGEDVYSAAGSLNVEKLSQLVFSDSEARTRVNEIIHPQVLREIQNRAKELSAHHKLVGVEAALIFESKMQEMLDAVVVVSAPLEKRIAWIQRRNNLPREEIIKRIQSQIPLTDKVKLADYVIENDGSLQDLSDKVDALYLWLMGKLS
jgi:dephospho-CoA kinase